MESAVAALEDDSNFAERNWQMGKASPEGSLIEGEATAKNTSESSDFKLQALRDELNAGAQLGLKNDSGNVINTFEKGGGGDEPIVWHKTRYDRMHGDSMNVMKKAFGTGLLGFFNLLNPIAWVRYRKMLKEFEDDSLAKKTHTIEYQSRKNR